MVSVAPPHLLEGASAIGVIHAGYSAVNAGPGLSSHRRPNSEQSVPPASACRTSLPLLLRRWLWPPSTSNLDVAHEAVHQGRDRHAIAESPPRPRTPVAVSYTHLRPH